MNCKYNLCDGSGYTEHQECGQGYEEMCKCQEEKICKNCGFEFGNHRAIDEVCPKWGDTKFNEVD